MLTAVLVPIRQTDCKFTKLAHFCLHSDNKCDIFSDKTDMCTNTDTTTWIFCQLSLY